MNAPELVAGYVVAGKYAIRSLLRHGGAMASYRASGPKNREVVLKICDPALSSQPAVLQTIAQYQSICAKLPPQLVLSIFDSGTDPNSGAPFFVSEFESRPTLAQLIERGPLSPQDMANLIRNVARAMDSLHASGIAGLTLHPSNVFVTPGTQEVRIADFAAGLVRQALAVPAEKAVRQMPWLAPEQIKAQAPPARASDVFALGLLGFFAVTGKSYWRSVQAKSADVAALRREVLGERMPASVRASEYAVSLNPAVDAVFGRALAFRAADRFGTAGEFAASLSAAMFGESGDSDMEETARFSGSELLASIPVAADSGLDAAGNQRRKVPPPRKMPDRGTMLGMGAPAAQAAAGAAAQAPAARPPLGTMMGIGERAAPEALPPTANASGASTDARKVAPPPMPAAAPAKAGPPPMPAPGAEAGPRPNPAPLTKGGSLPKTTMLGIAPQANAAVQAARNAAPEKPLAATMMGHAAPPVAPAPPAAPERPLAGTMMGYAAPPAAKGAPEKTLSPNRGGPPALPGLQTNAFLQPPAAPTGPAPAKAAPPPMPAAPSNTPPGSPALPKYAEPPAATTAPREAPPALPMAPPPAEIAQVLASFEATPFVPNGITNEPAPGASPVDVAIGGPAWSASAAAVPSSDVVQTDVAMVGADVFAPPNKSKKSRVLVLAGIGGFLLVTAGVALALSGGSSKDMASKPKTTASAEAIAQEAPHVARPEPVGVEPPAPAAQEPAAAPAPPEPPAAVAPAAPPPAEPSAAEPALPKNEPAAPAAPRTGAPASKKPCGKFLKRCK
jgi:serine/threonine protein kinase